MDTSVEWTTLCEARSGRGFMEGIWIKDHIYCISSDRTADGATDTPLPEVYNISSQTWLAIKNLPRDWRCELNSRNECAPWSYAGPAIALSNQGFSKSIYAVNDKGELSHDLLAGQDAQCAGDYLVTYVRAGLLDRIHKQAVLLVWQFPPYSQEKIQRDWGLPIEGSLWAVNSSAAFLLAWDSKIRYALFSKRELEWESTKLPPVPNGCLALYASETTLFATTIGLYLWMFPLDTEKEDTQWTRLARPGQEAEVITDYAVRGNYFVLTQPSGTFVLLPDNTWFKLGSQVGSPRICIDNDTSEALIVGVAGSGVDNYGRVRLGGPKLVYRSLANLPTTASGVATMVKRGENVAPAEWVMTVQTSAKSEGTYSGSLQINLENDEFPWPDSRRLARLDHGKIQFIRNQRYTYLVRWNSTKITRLYIFAGEKGWLWNTQFAVESIRLWHIASNKSYHVKIGGNVPFRNVPTGDGYSVSDEPLTVKEPLVKPGKGIVKLIVWVTHYLVKNPAKNMGLDVSFGHAAMKLDDGTYISWWPRDTNKVVDTGDPHTYEQDLEIEGIPPDAEAINLGHLDTKAISIWWATFRQRTQNYNLVTQNCAFTVLQALVAGGVEKSLPHFIDQAGLRLEYDGKKPTLPSDVIRAGHYLSQHGFAV
jgi:hypothetical protein